MVRKTRKNKQYRKDKGVHSIPELRRSFEHIERSVDEKIHRKDSREMITRALRKEWHKIFMKDLDKKSAEAFIDDRMKHTMEQKGRRRTLRTRGGASAIAGAPLDYTTRQGVYLAPGQIPDKTDHLPLTGNKPSDFGSYLQYVSKGFSVGIPEPGQSYDPVPGQSAWPQVPAGMGSNTVHFAKQGGSRRKIRRGGGVLDTTGTLLSQACSRPFGASSPPGLGQNLQSMWYGSPVGPSPDQVQRHVNYQLGSVYPKAVNLS